MPASRPENETHPARPLCRAEVAPAGAPALRAVLVLLSTHTGGSACIMHGLRRMVMRVCLWHTVRVSCKIVRIFCGEQQCGDHCTVNCRI